MYLHGVETIEKEKNNFTITDADLSAVVIIGTKPVFLIENSENIDKIDVANYIKQTGNNMSGFTIPDAVETVLKESNGAEIYTINIFDPDKHVEHLSKSLTFTENACTLPEKCILNLTLKKGNNALVYGEDYEFTANTIIILGNDTENITAEYDYADFSKITDTDVVGKTDENGVRSGVQSVLDIIAIWGKTPGIIIAPGFTSKIVRNAVEEMAEKIKAFAYLDAPETTKISTVEKARLKEADGIDLTSTSERVMLAMPYVKRYNQFEDKTELKPMSPVLAGLRVKLDTERNVAKSIDNTKTTTTLGTEIPISFVLDDPTTDSNRINAQGVATVINYKGEYRTWGARNASYPSHNGIKTFEPVRRTADLIEKSIQEASFGCVGEKITRGFIDDVLNVINNKFAAWAGGDDPLIYGGEAYFDETLNTAETIADGHIYFPYDFCPVSVAERITFHSILDIKYITKALEG